MSNKLPKKMRAKVVSSGKTFYYYDTCLKDKNGKRTWVPLGCVFVEAAKKYAELEGNKKAPVVVTFKFVADRYMAEVLPTKSPGTHRDNLREYKKLMEFFNDPPAPVDEIRPVHIREYLDWRVRGGKGYVRANREKSLFSHMFNKAREWGYTSNVNPCQGVKGYKEDGRDIYVFDNEYKITYDAAEQPLRDAMDLLYFTGQRPADVLKMDAKHIIEGALEVQQNKRGRKLRILLEGEFALVIARLPKEGKLLRDIDGTPLIARRLRTLFDNARKIAGTTFQMRDLRAKAGTDKEDSLGMEAAKDQLGHKHQATTVKYVRNRRGKKVSPTK